MAISFKAIRNLGLLGMTAIIMVMCILFFIVTTQIITSITEAQKGKTSEIELAEYIRDCFFKAREIFFSSVKMEKGDIRLAIIFIDDAIKNSEVLKNMNISENQKKEVVKLITAGKRFRVAIVTYTEEAQIDISGAMAKEMERVAMAAVVDATAASGKLVRDIRAEIKAINDVVLSVSRESQVASLIGMFIGLVFSLLIAFFMGRSLSGPIRRLVEGTHKIAKGDLDCRIKVESGDEIGQLADAFNKMAEGLAKEITERKKAMEAITISAQQWSYTFDSMKDAISVIDLEGHILKCNKSMKDILGKSDEQIIGHHCWELVHGTQAPIEDCPIESMRLSLKREYRTLQLGEKYLYITADPILDERNKLIGAVHTISDITERKQMEEKLKGSEKRYRALFNASADAIMIVEPPKWYFTSCNPAAIKMFKAKNEADFISITPSELSPEYQPDGRPSGEKALEMMNMAMLKGSHYFEWTHKRTDGEEFFVTVFLTKVTLEGREFLQAAVRDISEYKKLEEELRKKMINLERFNKLAVGRELKMKELKERIARLEGNFKRKK